MAKQKNGTRRHYSNGQINWMSFPSGGSNYNSYVVTDFCNENVSSKSSGAFCVSKQACDKEALMWIL